jgi:hypothetical protein
VFLDPVILREMVEIVLHDSPQHFHPLLLLFGLEDAALSNSRGSPF